MNNLRIYFENKESGTVLIFELVLMFVVSLTLLSILGYAAQQTKLGRSTMLREQALHVAEAGINYYQWHLAHFPEDYTDGNGGSCSPCGPYVHDYIDSDTQEVLGQYSLTITPPLVGSTVTEIESKGWTTSHPSTTRVIRTKYGIPSLAKFAFLTNSDAWIGAEEIVNGPFHTNGGVRFDGEGNAPITSAKETYTCTSTFGCSPSETKPGVWGAAPSATQSFWQYPVPNQDFSGISTDLAEMKSKSQLDGIYLPPSSARGYSLVFSSDGTVTVYKVTSLRSHATGTDVNGVAHPEDIDYKNRTLQFIQNLPTNGIIFVEDDVWVEGVVNGRVTVAAAQLPYNPGGAPDIMIPNSITYLAKDGTHSLGLISQRHVLVTYFAPVSLEIDAALIAQNGSCQRYYYNGNVKNSISIFGSVSSFGTWTWSWVNGSNQVISGYSTTSTTYDSNLLYSPPPSFPLTADGYTQLSWESD